MHRLLVSISRTTSLLWSVVPSLPKSLRLTRLVVVARVRLSLGEIDNKWKESAWAKKLAARAEKAAMNDFSRFKARYAKKH